MTEKYNTYGENQQQEDPLVELARIVSAGNMPDKTEISPQDLPHQVQDPSNDDMIDHFLDIEAELDREIGLVLPDMVGSSKPMEAPAPASAPSVSVLDKDEAMLPQSFVHETQSQPSESFEPVDNSGSESSDHHDAETPDLHTLDSDIFSNLLENELALMGKKNEISHQEKSEETVPVESTPSLPVEHDAMDFSKAFERTLANKIDPEVSRLGEGSESNPKFSSNNFQPDLQSESVAEKADQIPINGFVIADKSKIDPLASCPAAEAAEKKKSKEQISSRLQSSRSKNRLIAFSILFTVLAGMVGIIGFGFFGDIFHSGEIKTVKADLAPVKIKPADPGGSISSNADNLSYSSVSGEITGNHTGQTAQKTLVRGSEEPLNIAAFSDRNDSPLANVQQQGLERADSDNSQGVKFEEKSGSDSDLSKLNAIMLPRKVHTFSVKPDGTIVGLASTHKSGNDPSTSLDSQIASVVEQSIEMFSQDPSATSSIIESPVIKEIVNLPEGKIPLPQFAPPRGKMTNDPVAIPENLVLKRETVQKNALGGPYFVQISSRRNKEAAQASHDDLLRKFSGLLEGKSIKIQEANIEGKGIYYRIRVVFQSQSKAFEFCEVYRSAGGKCFVPR